MQFTSKRARPRVSAPLMAFRDSIATLLHAVCPCVTANTDREQDMEHKDRGWHWAYAKVRGYHVSALHAFYRATRYVLIGDTGAFSSHGGWRKSRITRR